MDRALVLRLGAAIITVLSLFGASDYVAANPKNPTAPLQPSVAGNVVATPRATGRIQVAPGVRATELPGITFTHVS